MKRIVFASGKGGTGKTTFTAAVAHVASQDSAVTLADCDVEAANLPIALLAHDISATPFTGGAKAIVDSAACTGCGVCADACRFDALIAPAYPRTAFAVDPLLCEGCGACIRGCATHAIRMETGQAGEVCSAVTQAGPIAFGRLIPGEDLSGKLVTEVRKRAEEAGAALQADYLLIDGPPGTGCPVTAAITNTDLLVAVTEPTLSGEHDLMRLVLLARRLNVPVVVALNKADLSDTGASRLRQRALAEGLDIIAEVPFDPDLASALTRMMREGRGAIAGPVAESARSIWNSLRQRLS